MFAQHHEFGTIFSRPASIAGCVLWTVCWTLLHRCLPLRQEPSGVPALEARLWRFYVLKLRRMLAYCCVASSAGLAMFLVSAFQAEPVKSMLMSFGPVQQFFFWMAVGHWITALWEDWRTRSFLHQGLTSNSAGGLAFFPLNLCCSSAQVMYCMYTAHHVVTVFAYLYTLATYQLGGVMVQGLIFELPVMFMLRRELGNAQHELPGWLQHERSTSRHWRLTYLMFFAGRGIAEVLWVMSMLPGHSGTLQDCLSDASLVVYHTLAVFFTSLNVRILGLLMCWHQQDVSRARSLEPKGAQALDDPKRSSQLC